MKKYKKQNIEISLDVVVGDAVLSLIESGIDEGTHFWANSWKDIDNDDLEFALNNPSIQARMIEYIRLPLIEHLKKALKERRDETAPIDTNST
jgi:hypothetical protein